MTRQAFIIFIGVGLLSAFAANSPSRAATSFSNSLTGFNGDSSQPAIQTALAAAGFSFADTRGFTEDPPGNFFNPQVEFDASGAHFGNGIGGDPGRNFMRTIDDDYANYDVVAEITVEAPFLEGLQASWLGMGTGDVALFGWPDWSTQVSSVMAVPEASGDGTFRAYTTMYTDNDTPIFANNDLPGLGNGTHRLRLTVDRTVLLTTATFSIDLNYAGGAFVSDFSAPPLDISGLYGPDGWPIEPSRIYFGGDDNAIMRDFSVNVTGPAVIFGDLDSDGDIDSDDWDVFRSNQEADLTGETLIDAYFRGDLDQNNTNDHLDFSLFKTLFEATNGSGSFTAMLAGVPEPSSMVLMLSAGLYILSARRRILSQD